MEHQDWDTFYIRGNKEVNKKKDKKDTKDKKDNITYPSFTERKLEKQIEEGNLKHKKTSIELGKIIEQKRLKMNMTRKDLAHKINLSIKNIDDIENGKAKYSFQEIFS